MTVFQDIKSADPVLDPGRLQEILDLDLLSEEDDDVLQEALAEVAQALELPMGLVTVVLNNAQYFAAMHGVEGWLRQTRGTPIEWSFCTNVVRTGEPFVVHNAVEHPQTKDNPMVPEEGVRSYCGVPLRTSRGYVLGSLCVIGNEAHPFQEEDVALLETWAERAVVRLEARRGRKSVG